MKIMMLSVHRSLVKYESEVFSSLGHEVCTVHDLWNGNYAHSNEQTYATPPREPLPYNHSCKNRKLAVSNDDMVTLGRIDLTNGNRGNTNPDENALRALLANFDALYVQMVPAWLLAYGEPMLKAGKKVFLRVFGHPFSEIGNVLVNNNENVARTSQYKNMIMVPVLETESHIWSWWKGRLVPIMAAICPSLIGAHAPERRSGLLSVSGYFDESSYRMEFRKRGMPWRHMDFSKQHVSDDEMFNAMSQAALFMDVSSSPCVAKYSSCEATILKTPVLLPAISGHAAEMRHDGVNTDPFCYKDHRGLYDMAERYVKDMGTTDGFRRVQEDWLLKKQALARKKWTALLSSEQ